MKSYTTFGIYDFSDFAEELDEQQLFAVNGGTNYGQCGGGNIVVLDNGNRAFFMEQNEFSLYFGDDFGPTACAATSLLNH